MNKLSIKVGIKVGIKVTLPFDLVIKQSKENKEVKGKDLKGAIPFNPRRKTATT